MGGRRRGARINKFFFCKGGEKGEGARVVGRRGGGLVGEKGLE